MSLVLWQPSDAQKRAILLLEALGLIHDLGKLSNRFLQSQEPASTIDYEHRLVADPRLSPLYAAHTTTTSDAADTYVQEILNDADNKPSAFQERTDLTIMLEQVTFTDWTGQQYNFAELMPLVARPGLAHTPANWIGVLAREMQPGLLVGGLHGPAHIEKEGEPSQHKQPYLNVFRATPFGLEEQVGTSSTFEELTDALSKLPLDDITKIVTDQRSVWLAQMKMLMSRGLADNRRPHNEVSLWDWGYTVATMTKAAAAYIFRRGWPTNLNNLPYRTLRVNPDILERYTRSDKISNLLGVSQSLNESYLRVQALLEELYALGNLFYQDETGIYYLLPDIFDDEELAVLRREIQAHFAPDLCPRVYFGDRITAGQLDGRSPAHDPTALRRLVTGPRSQALSEASTQTDNNLYLFESEWTEGRPTNTAICVACGVRPIGYPQNHSQPDIEQELATWATQAKASRRNICRVCLDRRGRRAEQWARDGLQGTIWTDEVADTNGRLALLVGKFDLEGWLDGTLLDTLRVTSTTSKKPSPARLYRIVETARTFWKQVSNTLVTTVVGKRQYRLALYPGQNLIHDLGDFHTYELVVKNVSLSIIWDKPNKRFLAVDNLSYVATLLGTVEDKITNLLQGHSYEIREPSAFLSSGQVLGKLFIEQVKRLDGYLPAIPLLAEPSACLMLVPAEKALKMAHEIKREYERQMGRVRDRLPLHLGLIFFHRRTPVRTVLEAGRGMLQMNAGVQWEGWRLTQKNLSTTDCELIFDNGISWHIPVVTGDGSTRDEWYPRMYEGDTYLQRQAKHVSELRVRDSRMPLDRGRKVWVQPSRFDFEFLDTTSRRFEIYYNEDGRRASRPTRPFYLEDLDRLEILWCLLKQLERTQRYQVITTIEATRELWYGSANSQPDDMVFQQFVSDTLAGAAWTSTQRWDADQHQWIARRQNDPQPGGWQSIPAKWQQHLIQAGVRGELADLLELRMEILKER